MAWECFWIYLTLIFFRPGRNSHTNQMWISDSLRLYLFVLVLVSSKFFKSILPLIFTSKFLLFFESYRTCFCNAIYLRALLKEFGSCHLIVVLCTSLKDILLKNYTTNCYCYIEKKQLTCSSKEVNFFLCSSNTPTVVLQPGTEPALIQITL